MTEENPLAPEQLAKPLTAPIEHTSKHDPYINRTFIAMMEKTQAEGEFTPEMPDFTRSLSVGLGALDPERVEAPADPKAAPAGEPINMFQKPARTSEDGQDVMTSTDSDGDKITFGYSKTRSAILIRTSPRGFYLSMVKVPGLVKWLLSRKAKHEGDGAVPA